MVSNMTKAFLAKDKRALGCRSGYAAGGTTDVFRTGSQSRGLLGAPDYGTGPKQTGFVWNDGTPRGGPTPDQGQRPATQDPLPQRASAAPP
jgi:hypothetical protein